MDAPVCAFCRSPGVQPIPTCTHFLCENCSQQSSSQAVSCPLCVQPKAVDERKSVFPCIFEQRGPGKCPHGLACPRSHDPLLLMSFWNPPKPQHTNTGTAQPPKATGMKFIYNSYFSEDETKRTEFKACSPQNFETQVAVHMLAKYICAFLNTMGGVLYYGITDDHVVKGLILNSQQRDKLRLAIDQCCNSFHPEVDTDKVSVKFEKVFFVDGGERKDAFVVVIKVQKGDSGTIYFTPDHKAWSKRQASIRELKSTSLVAFIKKKLEGCDDDEDCTEEEKEMRAVLAQRKWPRWDYYCHTRGMWIEYPEDIQATLEHTFVTLRETSMALTFRDSQSVIDFKWMREASGALFYEARRLDWRQLHRGAWWTIVNEVWYKFDEHISQTLDREYLSEKPDSEVSIDDFVYYVSFDRMRLTGETPIWRTVE